MQGTSKMGPPSASLEHFCSRVSPNRRAFSAAQKLCRAARDSKISSGLRGAKDGKALIFRLAASPATEGGRKGLGGRLQGPQGGPESSGAGYYVMNATSREAAGFA